MKKHFSDEQIISILREAEARVSVRELCRKHAIFDATFAPGVRSMAVLEVKRLTCVGDFTKACLTSGVQVSRILDCIALFRGYPATIRTDQGPEFTCRILEQWVFEQNVELRLIQPGKPTQNGFIKSFNRRFRDECLNKHGFSDIVHARKIINDWRQDYNGCRPHLALNYQSPSEFAARW
ncbi:integrase core domain-containing protein [Pantoea allii]|nr:integrase core domain-containing protein [Pantoea allii]MCH9300404.1 integrase core domain-containing protein [Pantoea allii]